MLIYCNITARGTFRDDFGLGEATRMHAAFPRYQVIAFGHYGVYDFVVHTFIHGVNDNRNDEVLPSDATGLRLHPGHHKRHHAG